MEIETDLELSTNNLYNYEIFKRITWFLSLKEVLSLGATSRILNEFVEVYIKYI